MLLGVNHIQIINRLRVRRLLADQLNRRGRRDMRRYCDIFGRHQTAGSIRIIIHQFLDFAGILVSKQIQDRFPIFFVHLVDQVCRIVRGHLIDDVRRFIFRQLGQNFCR